MGFQVRFLAGAFIMKKRKIPSWLKYVLYFVVFSFAGSLLEYFYGFLDGTGISYDRFFYHYFQIKIFFIPYYGVIGLILLFFNKYLDKKKIKTIYRGVLNAVVITSWEFVSGLFCLIVLKQRFWDYSEAPLNFLGIVSFPMFLKWILIGYLFAIVYEKLLKKFFNFR